MALKLRVAGVEAATRHVEGGVEVRLGDRVEVVAVSRRPDGTLLVGGRPADVEPGEVSYCGERIAVVEVLERPATAAPRLPAGALSAPTPGTVARVLVAVGDTVVSGQPLLVLVAMKTEFTLSAPRAGVVLSVNAVPGASVRAGAPLVELGP